MKQETENKKQETRNRRQETGDTRQEMLVRRQATGTKKVMRKNFFEIFDSVVQFFYFANFSPQNVALKTNWQSAAELMRWRENFIWDNGAVVQ